MSEIKSLNGKPVKELTLNDLTTLIEDVQADLKIVLENQEEIKEKLVNLGYGESDPSWSEV